MPLCFGETVEDCPFDNCDDECLLDPENLERGCE